MKSPLLFISFFVLLCRLAYALGEISLSEVSAQEFSRSEHELKAQIENTSQETREVTLRAQLVFYDQNSPPGDIPVNVLRKDETLVLKSGEKRQLLFKFVEEGPDPLTPVRMEPELRIRRQRVWQY